VNTGMIAIHNNLTKQKQPFQPIDPQNVRMYVCGMTVYDFCHIGHARVLVVFDIIYRHLCHEFGQSHVTYIRNITDIDDKIIARANENNEDITALTSRYITAMNEDAERLGILPPSTEPKATDHIAEITAMIQALMDKNIAYQAKSGDVLYAVKQFPDYGKLSGKKIEDLRSGERVDIDESKRDPLDFVLWKMAKPGEPSWSSPWGEGRPGWHIECSAMSTHCLGNHFDIHGGGMDLQFPHHENEIAQSEGATGETFANVWIHNGFVRIDDEKMSKSLGNFFTIREVTEKYAPEVLRYFILTSHYRSPLNYSDVHLDNAKAALTTLYTALRGITVQNIALDDNDAYVQSFMKAMDDDFNTPEALSVLFEIAKEINLHRQTDNAKAQNFANLLISLASQLGILQSDPESYFQQTSSGDEGLDASTVEQMIADRNSARAAKDFATSDRLRDELLANNIILEDGKDGTSWRRK